MTEHYHYTESGLDFVYLANGFQIRHTPRGQVVSFTDLDGLHAAIGRFVVSERRRLSGPEVRFLRHELDLGQTELAALLGVAERTLARWERGDVEIPVTADATLRAIFDSFVIEIPAAKSPEELARRVSATAEARRGLFPGGGTTVYLRDVAQVRDGFAPQTNVVRQDGVRGVLLSVLKNGGASTLDIVANLRALLPRVTQVLPQDIAVTPLFDQSVFVKAAIKGVVVEALIAARRREIVGT